MKFFVVLALIVACVKSDGPNPDALFQHVLIEQIDAGLKRKYGDNFGDTEDNSCAKACVTTPMEGMGILLMVEKTEDVKKIYGKEYFTKLCGYHNATASCIRRCPETQRRAFMRAIFAPITYVCEGTDFIQHVDCFKENIQHMLPICLGEDKCGEKKQELITSHSDYKDDDNKTKASMETMIGDLCDFVQCSLQCGEARMIEKCGAAANNVFNGYFRSLVESLKEARYIIPSDSVIDIPPNCNLVGRAAA